MDSLVLKDIVCFIRYLYNSRPKFCFVVSSVSKFIDDQRRNHMTVIRKVLRYLWAKWTMEFGFQHM